ncbi:MAG: hypothetical protein M1837_007276 [Sclerophora amabilis]|nr:MAG: hypothetical protein M1837_007276 [Sclerophora amabilis]
MGRSRVMSFMSQFGTPPRSPTTNSFSSPPPPDISPSSSQLFAGPSKDSPPPPRSRVERPSSRPMSMLQTYNPPLMEVAQDTLPELQPIFTFLNSHSNKLYQEGYLLKLNDLDSQGKPCPDRNWSECFAQLVGTVLSLWDASALDQAGQDGEVIPYFINLTDASIKMVRFPLPRGPWVRVCHHSLTVLQIETLPTRNQTAQPLQNVLSISTAGKNRYLLHFNSLHSLTQWTAGIRLAMFEHGSLQELYTGSLIAGKGKTLNNMKAIMERARMNTEDWARVRFGAGTPWRRCWCVISPPDEKVYQKHQKQAKKKSSYDRPPPPLKGDIKFYDSKKTKKVQPIATITDAFSAYAIYPQSKALIDQSTLVKVEGTITIHSQPASTTEGFVFVMPESHAAVSGFEMMLRWLFPVFDTFGLYGRPSKLIADTLDVRGLMFAMPRERRYDYLEILDVSSLIHTEGSHKWREADWRRKMKELTAKRIQTVASGTRQGSRSGSRRGPRTSLPSRPSVIQFDDRASVMSSPLGRDNEYPASANELPAHTPPRKTATAPPAHGPFATPRHNRSVSESLDYSHYHGENMNGYATPPPPPPPPHRAELHALDGMSRVDHSSDSNDASLGRSSSESDFRSQNPANPPLRHQEGGSTPDPIAPPPAFAHQPGAKPGSRPGQAPELRRANSRMSSETLSQLARAGGIATAGAAAAWKSGPDGLETSNGPQDPTSRRLEADGQRGVHMDASEQTNFADRGYLSEGTRDPGSAVSLTEHPLPPPPFESPNNRSDSSLHQPSSSPPVPLPYQQRQTSSHDASALHSNVLDGSPAQVSELSGVSMGRKYDSSGASPVYQPSPLRNTEQHQPPGIRGPSDPGYVPIESHGQPSHHPTHDNNPTTSQAVSPAMAPSQDAGAPAQSSKIQSKYSVSRKPLPDRSMSSKSAQSAADTSRTTSSLGSLKNHVFDQDALDRIVAQNLGPHPGREDSNVSRQPSNISSNYDNYVDDDNDSTDSPDYASTRKSTETNRTTASVARPRTGVMRTVGTVQPAQAEVPVGDTYYRPGTKPDAPSSEIPSIDFGPTLNYAANPRTSVHLSGPTPGVSKSAELKERPAQTSSNASPQNGSPSTEKRHSYGLDNRQSPGQGNSPQRHSRSPSRALTPVEFESRPLSSGGSDPNNRRSVAWQPGMGGSPKGGAQARRSLTPEQFVQQRAQQSRTTPVYSHQRKTSRDMLRSETPPMTRRASGDLSTMLHGRTSPGEHAQRPQSRGLSNRLSSSNLLAASGDYSAHLSAREQEHVARVTGSPLLNMPPGGVAQQKQPVPGVGLIGAIEAREREKKGMKEGLSGHMVQHAIAQRQQQTQSQLYHQPSPLLQQQQQQQQQQQVQGYGRPQSYFGAPSPHQQQQYAVQQQHAQQQSQWGQPRTYMPGGWTSPAYTPGATPGMDYQYQQQQQHQQTPSQQYPPGSYFGNPPQGENHGYYPS